ncbi:Tll0287-like domain-containing protein [Portibacter lacus]|uniref:Tll0287-like domain-containing protein n=1 Tax=Portibacter lacus TaxID=1099794 RepID=A0AA37WD88_9BACT|nr:DUF3365 domain-containing protein [Portibacter lacus]GLR17681.1 hypothetical protein GCM10007940_22960 [Portibacter lacus]
MKLKFLIIAILGVIITSCNMEQKGSKAKIDQDQEALMQRGKEVAQNTFKALSQELKKSMEEGGIEKAIAYCNINALPITDSLSNEYHAEIKRTSAKYRNPKNAPTMAEGKVLLAYQELKDKGEDMKPKLAEVGGKQIFYAPIVMQEMCMKCHGPKDQISAYDKILAKYPTDLATGYKTGDLRGMWSITLLPNKI